ncbi:helix-turn-helix transcriptional regulator [Eubacterium callanderi]|uniref:helix-turn-helix transcriptional regulator n=1 Tax=Eubacterium callanderi TaxID=53442 RepID=UPI001AA172AA|nr:helix-turn-helix transcriptional regulator [Eubacterium callanderi]MBO1703222.1 helix-turn-helix transcriptional regulator [Eubacterium callanderi]
MYINKNNKEKLTERQYSMKLKQGLILEKDWEKEVPCFFNNLEIWRKINNYTLKEVAQEMENTVGVHYTWQYIRDIEKGKRKPTYDFMREFRFVFDENIDAIFFDEHYFM